MAETHEAETQEAAEPGALPTVLVTGGSGFVGQYVVRELLRRGYRPVCVLRSPEKLLGPLGPAGEGVSVVRGSLFDDRALAEAAELSNAVIHLVGIIREAGGQDFTKVHVEGTKRVLQAAEQAGLRRYLHMSALGAGPGAGSAYHHTKYTAERYVRKSTLDWTIFRPSIIHGPEGEFMRMIKTFCKPKLRPGYEALWLGMPYFGSGLSRVQPISVRDVAHCFVTALDKPDTIKQTYELGGPEAYTWRELYAICSEAIAGKVRRQISVPPLLARALAMTVMHTPLVPEQLKFDSGQVSMALQDSVCDAEAVEATFGLKFRNFKEELALYADQIQ